MLWILWRITIVFPLSWLARWSLSAVPLLWTWLWWILASIILTGWSTASIVLPTTLNKYKKKLQVEQKIRKNFEDISMSNTYRTLEVADRKVMVDKAVALSQNLDVCVVVVTKISWKKN